MPVAHPLPAIAIRVFIGLHFEDLAGPPQTGSGRSVHPWSPVPLFVSPVASARVSGRQPRCSGSVIISRAFDKGATSKIRLSF